MKDLITRLEAATEGSRDLDAAVHFQDFKTAEVHKVTTLEGDFWEIQEDGVRIGKVWNLDLPHYTTSLDAAVSLVPEGCLWSVHHDGMAIFTDQNLEEYDVDAATPALALCAASLKARQHDG